MCAELTAFTLLLMVIESGSPYPLILKAYFFYDFLWDPTSPDLGLQNTSRGSLPSQLLLLCSTHGLALPSNGLPINHLSNLLQVHGTKMC